MRELTVLMLAVFLLAAVLVFVYAYDVTHTTRTVGSGHRAQLQTFNTLTGSMTQCVHLGRVRSGESCMPEHRPSVTEETRAYQAAMRRYRIWQAVKPWLTVVLVGIVPAVVLVGIAHVLSKGAR